MRVQCRKEDPILGQKWDLIKGAISKTLFFPGLITSDLAILQIMQESIAEQERGTVFGVQQALCQFFGILRDIVCIIRAHLEY
ncbi:ferroportin1 (FPN1) domain-containing protein [Ditylenchus destructor]|uniref:Solute carrier family 40 member n=1 Tax=Ditylenchus destructor TaxID=166010 RepID=A0AAD4MUZ9_9BILA|nr:ferroportin1 (FPN1) domain-containing protein [Ditylenchus destructor]